MNTKRLMLSGVALGAAAALLAGCDRQPFKAPPPPPAAALPLTTASTGPLPLAPPADALPSAPRPRIAHLRQPRTHYGYIDRGYEISDVIYDAPPDYAFFYDDVEPWTWVTFDGFYLIAEPLYDGWRYYYYEPDAYYPFLVRDPFYCYGFDGGALVVVYDGGGRVLPPEFIDQRVDIAGRYLVRAQTLYQAAHSQPHQGVARASWLAQRPIIQADRARFGRLQQAVPEWRDYHQQRASQDRAHWAEERLRRATWAARVNEQLNDRSAVRQDRRIAEQTRNEMLRSQRAAGKGGVSFPVLAPATPAEPKVAERSGQQQPAKAIEQDRRAAARATAENQARFESQQRMEARAQPVRRNEAQRAEADTRRAAQAQQAQTRAAEHRTAEARVDSARRAAAAQERVRERIQARAQIRSQERAQERAQVRAEARAQERAQVRAQQRVEVARIHREAQQQVGTARAAERQAAPAAARVAAHPAQQPAQSRQPQGKGAKQEDQPRD